MGEWSLPGPFGADRIHPAAMIDAVFDSAPEPLPEGTRVHLLLPDSHARFLVLPWSPELMNREELAAYVRLRLKQQGLIGDESGTVGVRWGAWGRATLGYALEDSLLDRISERVAARQMKLERILPVSAVYHYGRLPTDRKDGWFIAGAGNGFSALVHAAEGELFHASEPGSKSGEALQRLLDRLLILTRAEDDAGEIRCAVWNAPESALRSFFKARGREALVFEVQPLDMGGW